jgi:hypothetical protein
MVCPVINPAMREELACNFGSYRRKAKANYDLGGWVA